MSILPMAPGPMRDKITGTKSSQQEIDAWNAQNQGGGMQYLGGSPTFDESGGGQQAPQQQAALNQAIQGPSFQDTISGTNLRGASQKVGSGRASGAASGALSGAATGASLGSVVPGIGNAIGAGIGAAVGGLKGLIGGGGIRANQASDMSRADFDKNAAAAYRTFLGREASPEEIRNMHPNSGKFVNQNMYTSSFDNIRNSPEAQAYAAKMAGQQAAPAAAPEAAAVAQAVAGPPAGGKGGILEGFSADKMGMGMDKQMKSPKYAFAAVAQKYDQSDPAQRQAMMAELKNHPSGFFKNAQLTGSKGDILDVGEQTDPVWGGIRQFDVIRAAGEGGKAWQWGERGGDSGGGQGGVNPAMYPNASGYNASGDPVLAAINGQSLNPVVNGMDMLRKLLGEIPGGLNGIAGGQ